MIDIFLLEDSALDAELIFAELRRAGLRFTLQRVETESDFRARLEAPPLPDVILADYRLPTFDGLPPQLARARENRVAENLQLHIRDHGC